MVSRTGVRPGLTAAGPVRRARRVATVSKTGIRAESLITVAASPMEEIARVARLHRCESVLVGLGEVSTTIGSVAAGGAESGSDSRCGVGSSVL